MGGPVNYATLSQITLPSGGTISYTYQYGLGVQGQNGGRWVKTRTVNANDGSGPHTWTYSYNSGNTVVSDPLGNDVVHTFTNFANTGVALYETTTQYWQGSSKSGGGGTVLKTVNTTYSYSTSSRNAPVTNVVPTAVSTVWPNKQTTTVNKGYDSGFSYHDFENSPNTGIYGRQTSETVIDYTGLTLRTTNTGYVWQSPHPNYSSYLNNNLIDLTYSIQVNDGGGAQRAYSYYGYDEAGLQSSGIAEQKVAGESYPGNATTVRRWLNGSTTATTNCNVSVSNGYLVSNKVYYDTGEVQKSADPCTYPTTYEYSSAYYGAFVTKATNDLNQITTYTYDLNTGALTSITDPNSQTTTKQYDILTRPTQIGYPDGGSTTACYTDMGGSACSKSGPPYELVVTNAINSSSNETSTIVFDGLGRTSQTQLNSDPDGIEYVATTYDGLGRRHTVSNPYRSTSDSTYGITTYAYDALNRITAITNPDGSLATTSYIGRAKDVADEGNGTHNVERASQVDGLGRLVSVCEVSSTTQLGAGGAPGACGQDIAKTGFLTSYSYDALNNLLTVSQGSLAQRTFAYDSLSRLLCAANPETGRATCPTPDTGTYTLGTTRYGYDANGNMAQRIRPAPNQTSPSTTVTTTYAYDSLNRVTQKSYSDGVTPTARFGYDQASVTMGTQQFSINNSGGRLSWSATVTQSGSMISMEAFSYDPMGRVAQRWQSNPVNSNSINIAYGYDYLGDEISRNLSGTTTTANYNGAGRLTAFTATNYVDANNPANLLANVHYDPMGHMISGTLASGLSLSWGYDSRGRVKAMQAGTNCSAGACSNGPWPYGYLMTSTSNQPGYAPNGNVLFALDSTNGFWAYTYDDLNRLATSTCSNACPNGTSTQAFSYGYDRYGNRWNQTVTAGSGPQPNYTFTGAQNNNVPNNRMDSFSYDAAGNLLNDGTNNYTYDAENRIKSVNGATTYTYDAEDRRVAKTSGSSTTDILYDREGHVLLYNSNPAGVSSAFVETYVAGMHLGTYYLNSTATATSFYYDHADWLGTERARTNLSGIACETIGSLPFGDGQTISGTCGDISPMHFTGKERDTESNLDNFEARYYSSTMGRFMTPDWAAKPVTVPYAQFGDPQTLNLYTYVENGPLNRIDSDGHKEEPVAVAPCHQQTCVGQQAQNNAAERITMGIEAAANLYVAKDKAEIALGLALSTPESGPAATAAGTGAALASISALSSALTGTAQAVGAITGKTEEANKVADGLAASTSVSGLITTVVTNGDVKKAAAAASIEGIATSSFKREIFKSGASIAEAAVSIIDLVTAPPAPPRPPVPGPPPTQ